MRYPQPDGRGIVPRKWPAAKDGPDIYLAEVILKKMIQFGWPCSYTLGPRKRGSGVVILWRSEVCEETPEFLAALETAVQTVALSLRVKVECDGLACWLVGPHWLKLRRSSGGVAVQIKAGLMPPPF